MKDNFLTDSFIRAGPGRLSAPELGTCLPPSHPSCPGGALEEGEPAEIFNWEWGEAPGATHTPHSSPQISQNSLMKRGLWGRLRTEAAN